MLRCFTANARGCIKIEGKPSRADQLLTSCCGSALRTSSHPAATLPHSATSPHHSTYGDVLCRPQLQWNAQSYRARHRVVCAAPPCFGHGRHGNDLPCESRPGMLRTVRQHPDASGTSVLDSNRNSQPSHRSHVLPPNRSSGAVPTGKCLFHSSATDLAYSSGSWYDVRVPGWVHGNAAPAESSQLHAAVEMASLLASRKYSMDDVGAVEAITDALAMCSTDSLHSLKDGPLSEPWQQSVDSMCKKFSSVFTTQPQLSKLSTALPMFCAFSRTFSLLPWCEPIRETCLAAFRVVEMHMDTLDSSGVCNVARAMANLQMSDSDAIRKILECSSRCAATSLPSDIIDVTASLLSLLSRDDGEHLQTLASVLSCVVPVDSAVGPSGLLTLAQTLERLHGVRDEISCYHELAAGVTRALAASVDSGFPQVWMLSCLHSCDAFLTCVPVEAEDLALAMHRALAVNASFLSCDQLSAAIKCLTPGGEEMQRRDLLPYLHHNIYSNIVRHITSKMNLGASNTQLINFLHCLKRHKMLDYNLAAFVAERLLPRLAFLTACELEQLLVGLQWAGSTSGLSTLQLVMSGSGSHGRVSSQLPRPSCDITRSLKLFIVPECRRRLDEFSSAELGLILRSLAGHNVLELDLLNAYLERHQENDWDKLVNTLFLLSEAAYGHLLDNGKELAVTQTCHTLVDNLRQDFTSKKFIGLCNALPTLRSMSPALLDHLSFELLSTFISRKDASDCQLNAECLDVAWQLFLSRDTDRNGEFDMTAGTVHSGQSPAHTLHFFLHQLAVTKRLSTWSDAFCDTLVTALLQLNCACSERLEGHQVDVIGHAMLELAHRYPEPSRSKMAAEAGQFVQRAQIGLLRSLPRCNALSLAGLVQLIHSIQQLAKLQRVQFDVRHDVYLALCSQAESLYRRGQYTARPTAALNMFNILSSLHQLPAPMWQLFDQLATGAMHQLTAPLAVDVGAVFISERCISDAFVDQLIRHLVAFGLGSLNPIQLLRLPRVLLAHSRPSLPHLELAEGAVLTMLRSNPKQVPLHAVVECIGAFAARLHRPGTDLVDEFARYLEEAWPADVVEAEQLLPCLAFFGELSHPVGKLAKMAHNFTALMLQTTSIVSIQSMIRGLVSLHLCKQAMPDHTLGVFLAKRPVQSALIASSVESACWLSMQALSGLVMSSGSSLVASLGAPSPEQARLARMLLAAHAHRAAVHLELLNAQLRSSDWSLQSLDNTLRSCMMTEQTVDRCIVTESLCPVWRAVYIDHDGTFASPASLDRIDTAEVCARFGIGSRTDTSSTDSTHGGDDSEPSARKETDEAEDPYCVVDGSVAEDATFSKVTFGCRMLIGGTRVAIVPRRPGVECTLDAAAVTASASAMEARLASDGWKVLAIPLGAWSQLSSAEQSAMIMREVLSAK